MDTREKEILIYKNIDFYNRYERLSQNYQFNDTFENYSNEEVLKFIKQFGYDLKYFKKENFFQIKEINNNMKIYLHICLKYGNVELIMGLTIMDTNEKIGDVFPAITKLIEIAENRERRVYKRS
jgi:hypothetical protein